MKKITTGELHELLRHRKPGERLALTECEFKEMDLTGWDLQNMDLHLSSFAAVTLDGADLKGSDLENVLLDGCSMAGACFEDANLRTASMRACNLEGCNIKGADLFGAVLEHANLNGIIADERTKWFRMHCPEEGPILGYKKCVNDRLVQLLIPADARRTSATLPSCRCDRAKVLTIKSFDASEEYEEAWSLVDEDFVYRKGEWVEVKNFNEDRWFDSTTGIHFWMSREDAIAY